MTIEEQLDRLTGIVGALADSVVSHDHQIGGLIKLAEKNTEDMKQLREENAKLIREWQAYLTTLRPQ